MPKGSEGASKAIRVRERAKARALAAKARLKGVTRPRGLSQRLKATGVKGRGGQKLSPDRPFNQIQNQVNQTSRDLRSVTKGNLITKKGRQRIRRMLRDIPKVQKLAQKVPDRFRFDNMRPGFISPRKPKGTKGNVIGGARSAGMRTNTGGQLKRQATSLSRFAERIRNTLKKFPIPGPTLAAPKVSPERLRERTVRRESLQ